MRKLRLFAALALAGFAAVPIASSQAAPSHDQVTGTGTVSLGEFGVPTVHVNANQTNNGVKGSFTITYPDGTFATGSVTCLAVTGITAYVTGRITESGGPRGALWPLGNYVVIGVQDNGEPGTGADRVNFSPSSTPDPGCGPNPANPADPGRPEFNIVEGNYQVSDAP